MTIICHEKYKKDYNCKIKYINEILRIALTNNLSPTSYSLVRNAYFPPPALSTQLRILWLATTDLKVLKSFKVMICPGDLLLRRSIRQLSAIYNLKKDSLKFNLWISEKSLYLAYSVLLSTKYQHFIVHSDLNQR